MGWGPSAIYTIEHTEGWKIDDVRISNLAFGRAEKGNLHSQTKICLQFRDRIVQGFGGDPGFIYYDDLKFIKTRDVPANAKRPPKMKAASSMLKDSHTATLTPRR